ncbi:efflux transporter outer membrane subunit [Coraliomargarita sp. SDUM461004]|uniref:Efflux transporter outer membrane subunit n=1 Tax=Thalassobacterium sedimentorum TaxID=3041258 RepID=A0ABU1AJW2_9BACT|nr:efflux transporter outer membrane subunit [Coraliomargarita sp. SDUM461004]MDQ8194929.1 efflux transporter outer membrane subunit [Coraliomargarita sp. SDUM461004]
MIKQNHTSIQQFLSAGAITLSLGWLTACATTSSSLEQKAHFDTQLPHTWQSVNSSQSTLDTAALSRWWQRFDDPQMEALITDAIEKNPDLRSALSTIRQARAERGLESAELWPSLAASIAGSGTQTRDLNNSNSTHSDSYQAALDASWEVDLFGRQQQYVAAADAALAASEEDYRQAQVTLAAEVASTYLTLCSYTTQLDIVRQNLATRESTQEIVQWQEQAGESDALNSQQSIAATEQVRAQIPELEQSLVETRNSLAILTGRTPAALQGQLQLPTSFPSAPANIAVGIPAETLRQRPDIRSSENTILAAQARLTAAERSRLPSLNLSGSIGIEALQAGDLLDPQSLISNLAAGLSAPLWDAGRIRRNIEVQNELLQQAYLEYENTVLNALAEVENALSSIDKRNQQITTLQRACEAAQNATQLAQLQYKAGEVDLLTVLDAQRTELSLDQSLTSTQAEALNAHVQLYKALGGGWDTSSANETL